MQLAKKIRIYPTKEQVDVLWELSDKCRIVYNFALADKKDTWTSEKRSVKYTEQQNKLPDFKKRNPEFKSVYSKTYQGILKKLEGSYNSFFGHQKNGNKKARPPNFKGRNYLMTLPYNQSGFKIEDGIITFSQSHQRIFLNDKGSFITLNSANGVIFPLPKTPPRIIILPIFLIRSGLYISNNAILVAGHKIIISTSFSPDDSNIEII